MTDIETVDNEKTAIGTLDPDVTQAVMEPQAEATQFAANVECPVCHTPNPPSETYCIDCGFMLSTQPVTVSDAEQAPSAGTLATPDGTREFSLRVGENTVGRENADILLTHNSVSRRHAKVIVEDGHVYVEDAGSTNGTFVDGAKIDAGKRVAIKDGAELTFGSSAVRFKAAEGFSEPEAEPIEAEAAESEPVAGEAAAEEPEVVEEQAEAVGRLVSKDGSLSFRLVDGVNTLGRRSGENTIVVPDGYCSGRHAEIMAADGAFTITDVGSTNGTAVNGVKIEANAPRQLAAGDEIAIGETTLVLEVA